MLGYIISDIPGETDLLLQRVAETLIAEGRHLAGVTQLTNRDTRDLREKMILRLLPRGEEIAISQDLGQLAKGCSLDPDGLERAVGMVANSLSENPDLVLLNKFGKQEADGKGFRPVIAEALSTEIPVLMGVGRSKLPDFLAFTGDFANPLPKDLPALLAWCRSNIDT